MLLADSTGSVGFQQPREKREVQYLTANDERPHQRYQSERILPSVEVDDFDMKESARTSRHDKVQYWDTPPHDMNAHGCSRYPLRSAAEPLNHNDYPSSKRLRDDDHVYIISERPKRPHIYDDRDRIIAMPANRRAPDKLVHRRVADSMYEIAPGTVESVPRIVHLPPRALERNSNSDRHVHPEFRPRHDKHGRSLDLSHEQENVVPRENRRASYAQPAQRMLLPESYHAVDDSPSYSMTHKRASTFQPSTPRIIRMDSGGDGRFVRPADDPGEFIQSYDEHSRLVGDDALPRRGSAIYASSRRAIG